MLKKRLSLRTLVAAAAILLAGSAHAATMVIDSLTGDITTNEKNSFTTYVATQSPPTNNIGNLMADGYPGTTVEGLGLMYEATHDVTILNTMIVWCDTMMKYRNDLPAGPHQTMWDGVVEPIWPSIAPGSSDSGYAGCESGDVVGHIAYCAYLILNTPSLASTTVPDGNPNGYGATYKARAQTYVNMLDPGMSSYFTHWFINSSTYKFQTPTDSRWVNDAGNQTCTAWNRQMMFVNGYLRLAQCHDLLNDNPSFLSTYKAIVSTSANGLVSSAFTYSVGGHNVFNWQYDGTATSSTSSPEEVFGVHGEYDMLGLIRVYNAGTPYSSVTGSQMGIYANTFKYVIYSGADAFYNYVNGTGGNTLTYPRPGWIFISQFIGSAFTDIAQAQIDANKVGTWAYMDATILYMKHWRFINAYTGTYKIVSRNSGKVAAVSGASTAPGAAVVQYTYYGTTGNDLWSFVSVGGGYYKIVNSHSGLVLEVEGGGTANSTPCVQDNYSGPEDDWQIQELGGGYDLLVNRNSGKVLDVAGGSTANNAVVDQYRWIGPNQEQWQITTAP
jgi:hypothetical protein